MSLLRPGVIKQHKPKDAKILCLPFAFLLITVKTLYFAVFPMNIISLEFNFVDFVFVTLLQCTATVK